MIQLDPQKAIQGSQPTANRIESGKHIVKITQCYEVTAKTGAKAVHFDVENQEGAKAHFDIYTHKANGEVIGFNEAKIHAIMACAGIQAYTPNQGGTALVYDFEAKKEVQKQVTAYPEFYNKYVGILFIQSCSDYKGDLKLKTEFFAPFDYKTGRTAAEIMQQKQTAEDLPYLEKAAEQRTLQAIQECNAKKASQPQQQPQQGAMYQPTQPNDFENDDIPF